MGLFTRDYSKPGPGVDKDAPLKNALFRFFDLFARKFFIYLGLNMMYLVVLLPIIVGLYVNVYSYMFSIIYESAEQITSLPPILDICVTLYTSVPSILHMPLVIVSVVLYGPFTMGLTYIFRNFAREEHAWTSDFFRKSFANFKQGLFFGVLDVVIAVVVYFNWSYIGIMGDSSGMYLLGTAVRWLTVVAAVYYFFMRFYFYQLAVTVNLKITQIIKNAVIFGVLGLGRNALATVLVLAVFVLSTLVYPLLELVMVPFLMFSLCGFIAVYITYPIVDKHVVQPALAIEREAEESYEEAVLPPELGGPGAGSLAYDRMESGGDSDTDAEDDVSEDE